MDSSRDNLSSPAHYPRNITYKPLVEEILKQQKKEGQPSVSTLLSTSTSPKAGDVQKKYQLKDGGKLTILTNQAGDVRYHLKVPDGRQVFLEKSKTHMGLLVTDASGKAIKTLGCEL